MGLFDFFTGTPAEYEQVSNLTPEQLRIEKERRGAAKGAFQKSGDYWRDILSDRPGAFAAFEAPAKRQFQEEIIPDLAEQFAGMGSGNLSSSGFRNAGLQAGVGLSERLAAMRAGLRESAASNLYNLGQSSLQPHTQYQQTNPGSEGFLSNVAQGVGGAIPGLVAGGLPGAATGFLNSFGKTSPYGGGTQGLQGMSNAVQQSGFGYNPIGR